MSIPSFWSVLLVLSLRGVKSEGSGKQSPFIVLTGCHCWLAQQCFGGLHCWSSQQWHPMRFGVSHMNRAPKTGRHAGLPLHQSRAVVRPRNVLVACQSGTVEHVHASSTAMPEPHLRRGLLVPAWLCPKTLKFLPPWVAGQGRSAFSRLRTRAFAPANSNRMPREAR